MSFSFGFAGDDIEDEDEVVEQIVKKTESVRLTDQYQSTPTCLDFCTTLATLPSQISCNSLKLGPNLTVYRRSLFDIRAQLMAEADTSNDNDDLLAGLDTGDLTSGVYEGGLKTWECAIDLAEHVASMDFEGDWHIIELGAGSAIPTCALVQRAIREYSSNRKRRLHFTLCDYNEDVLKLCTAPNAFVNAYAALRPADLAPGEEFEIDLETIDTSSIIKQFESHNITVDFISGGWSDRFAELALLTQPGLCDKPANIMILASETIYSPESLYAFNDTLIDLLKSVPSSATALIAAKQIYFGVGGGVEDFACDIRKRGATVKTVAEVSTAGVGRVILEVGLKTVRS